MEEKKENKVKLEPVTTENAQEPISYEQLTEAFNAARKQIDQMDAYIGKLHEQIDQMGNMIQSKRLDYLFKVLENSLVIKDLEFITKVVDEIKASLFAPEQPVPQTEQPDQKGE